MAERGFLHDVKSRQLPTVTLGPQIILQDDAKFDSDSRFVSLISKDGHAHLFAVDQERRIHHIEISGNEVFDREMLGVVDKSYPNPELDTIESPPGKLRVVAGDKMFVRSERGKWQEIKGNRCQRFVAVGDDLLCAFIANGSDMGAPKRTDWTVGWFILIPVVFWSDVHADKLVLAQESDSGWAIRAVLDPETKLSARSDFAVGATRRGFLYFLYRTSGGSSAFIVAFGPGGGGAWGEDTSEFELRYARVQYDRFLPRGASPGDPGSGPTKPSKSWSSIQGLPMASIPFIKGQHERYMSLKSIGPLERRFTINRISGDVDGIIWASRFSLDDGIREIDASDMPWVQVKIKEALWVPRYDIVTASDLPDSGSRWINDRDALIKSDGNGNTHVLLVKSRHGFWRWHNELCYFLKTGKDWTSPLILGSNIGVNSRRSLAVDETGSVFAAWENRDNTIVGRWLVPRN